MKADWFGGYTLNRKHAVPRRNGFAKALCGRFPPPFGWVDDANTRKQKHCKRCEAKLAKQNKKP